MKAVLLWLAVLANVALTAFVTVYPVVTAPGPGTALAGVLGAAVLVPIDALLIVVAVVCTEGPADPGCPGQPPPPAGPVAPGKGSRDGDGPRLFDAHYGIPKPRRPTRPGGAA